MVCNCSDKSITSYITAEMRRNWQNQTRQFPGSQSFTRLNTNSSDWPTTQVSDGGLLKTKVCAATYLTAPLYGKSCADPADASGILSMNGAERMSGGKIWSIPTSDSEDLVWSEYEIREIPESASGDAAAQLRWWKMKLRPPASGRDRRKLHIRPRVTTPTRSPLAEYGMKSHVWTDYSGLALDPISSSATGIHEPESEVTATNLISYIMPEVQVKHESDTSLSVMDTQSQMDREYSILLCTVVDDGILYRILPLEWLVEQYDRNTGTNSWEI
ncbi:hypothetical protein C8R44DRAFT_752781 [Mycena epipterygia]|nr:hypothetical protein C8R44DRAFT_752781 [Mycena epipterygia]